MFIFSSLSSSALTRRIRLSIRRMIKVWPKGPKLFSGENASYHYYIPTGHGNSLNMKRKQKDDEDLDFYGLLDLENNRQDLIILDSISR